MGAKNIADPFRITNGRKFRLRDFDPGSTGRLPSKVHPEFLKAQKLPHNPKRIWKERFEDINAHERYLTRNGTVIRKFFLNVSREEQKRRFLQRIGRSEKNWK